MLLTQPTKRNIWAARRGLFHAGDGNGRVAGCSGNDRAYGKQGDDRHETGFDTLQGSMGYDDLSSVNRVGIDQDGSVTRREPDAGAMAGPDSMSLGRFRCCISPHIAGMTRCRAAHRMA